MGLSTPELRQKSKRLLGLREQEVIELMRKEMKPSSWRMWRA
ncbi:MAG: DUF2805 domain-containing protein, partial [Bacteroidota bacterium]